MFCGAAVAGCGLRVVGCGLRVAGCGLRVAGCGLRVVGCEGGSGFFPPLATVVGGRSLRALTLFRKARGLMLGFKGECKKVHTSGGLVTRSPLRGAECPYPDGAELHRGRRVLCPGRGQHPGGGHRTPAWRERAPAGGSALPPHRCPISPASSTSITSIRAVPSRSPSSAKAAAPSTAGSPPKSRRVPKSCWNPSMRRTGRGSAGRYAPPRRRSRPCTGRGGWAQLRSIQLAKLEKSWLTAWANGPGERFPRPGRARTWARTNDEPSAAGGRVRGRGCRAFVIPEDRGDSNPSAW